MHSGSKTCSFVSHSQTITVIWVYSIFYYRKSSEVVRGVIGDGFAPSQASGVTGWVAAENPGMSEQRTIGPALVPGTWRERRQLLAEATAPREAHRTGPRQNPPNLCHNLKIYMGTIILKIQQIWQKHQLAKIYKVRILFLGWFLWLARTGRI